MTLQNTKCTWYLCDGKLSCVSRNCAWSLNHFRESELWHFIKLSTLFTKIYYHHNSSPPIIMYVLIITKLPPKFQSTTSTNSFLRLNTYNLTLKAVLFRESTKACQRSYSQSQGPYACSNILLWTPMTHLNCSFPVWKQILVLNVRGTSRLMTFLITGSYTPNMNLTHWDSLYL